MRLSNFTFQELIAASNPGPEPEFKITSNTTAEALLIRILTGSIRITNNLTSDSLDQRTNYSILGAPSNTTISWNLIENCIDPESNIINLKRHIVNSRGNNTFFENILEEYCSFFHKKIKDSHTTGFLHLYRCLEYISYSFPLIYASIDRDYYGSFDKIKNYFNSSRNELTFFQAFVEKLLDEALLDSPLKFDFNPHYPSIGKNHYNIIKKILPKGSIIGDTQYISLTTTYRQLLHLSINLRNRYFHFSTGDKRNIKGTEIIENDLFFANINDELSNWISIIYFEILKHMCERV